MSLAVVPRDEDKIDFKMMRLDSSNYVGWKLQLSAVLKAKKIHECVTGNSLDPEKELQAYAFLLSAVDSDHLLKIVDCTTSKAVWDRLESIYENKTTYEKQTLLQKFNSYKIPSLSEMSKSIGEIQSLGARLKSIGASIDDDSIISVIINALPESFDSFTTTWSMMNSGNQNLNNLITNIMVETDKQLKKQEVKALVMNKPKYKGRPRRPQADDSKTPKNSLCNFCKKPGHWIRDCRKLKKKKEQEEGKDSDENSEKKAVAMIAKDSKAESTSKNKTMISSEWLADSGCSAHMTPNLEWIYDYKPFDTPLKVVVRNNATIQAKGSGNVITNYGVMYDTLYVPDLSDNLYSLSTAAKRGITANLQPTCIAFMRDGLNIHSANLRKGLYVLNFQVQIDDMKALTSATLKEWHERFGHTNTKVIKNMIDSGIVTGLEIINTEKNQCEDCVENKCKRACHPTRTTPKVDRPGVSLHFDTVGPVNPPSLGGSRYILVGKDEASGYKFTKSFETKAGIADEIKLIISKVEIETGNKVLQIVTDNGSEFKNSNLQEFLRQRGINHVFSAPYTPSQNGFIEREIRTIVESARTMIAKSKLNKNLWAEAVNTATYVLNRVPNSKHPDKTAYEIWFGRQPNVSNLHVFGQEAVVLKEERNRSGKWDSMGTKLNFLGYTENLAVV